MKILLVQLARFGDIYLTWPTVRALRRLRPKAEIHLLVRSRFAAATKGLSELDRVWELTTPTLLKSVICDEGGEVNSLLELNEFVDQLTEQNFTEIYNLSFSPFSSYLCSEIQGPSGVIRGYTRHSDGYLAIPDDASAYFYAQVGLGKSNRFHLSDIFASVVGVDLQVQDWSSPELPAVDLDLKRPFLVAHLGSSQEFKTYPIFKWRSALGRILNEFPGHIYLIGATSESHMANQLLDGSGFNRIHSLFGQTRIDQLFTLLSRADMLIGADSAPMHMASMVACPCFNLSLGGVNFWETGPRSLRSRILVSKDGESLASDRVASDVLALWKDQKSSFPIVYRDPVAREGYRWANLTDDDWTWRFIRGLYCGDDLPIIEDDLTFSGMLQMREMVQVCLEQFPNLFDNKKVKISNQILEQADIVFRKIAHFSPRLQPLVDWYFTERLRKGPASLTELIKYDKKLCQQLKYVLGMYLGDEPIAVPSGG